MYDASALQIRQVGFGFRVAAQKQGGVADLLNKLCPGLFYQSFDDNFLNFAVTDRDFYLDQLVVIECPAYFFKDGLGQALGGDCHDWVQGVANGAVGLFLFVAQCHRVGSLGSKV